MELIIAAIFGGGAIALLYHVFKCNHRWRVLDEGFLTRGGYKVGRYAYERCDHCHKMRTVQTKLKNM